MKKISGSKLYQVLCKRDRDELKRTFLWVLAIIGAIVAIAGIVYAVYRFLTPNYLSDFNEDFEDDFEDEYFIEDDF